MVVRFVPEYHAARIFLFGTILHADAFGDAIFVDSAFFSSTAVFFSAKVILEGGFVVKQNIDSVLDVLLFHWFLLVNFLDGLLGFALK